MSKSANAFRNISEVSDWLETPTHVLRFWESKFSQIKPTKRSGGRRYYRPKDMLLIGGIKQLLHIEGHTIKGAKQVLREKGLNYVVGLSRPLDLLHPEFYLICIYWFFIFLFCFLGEILLNDKRNF